MFAENKTEYDSIKFYVDVNPILKNNIKKVWNWKEYETLVIGGEDMFKQEYEVEFINPKVKVLYTNEKNFISEYVDVDKELYDIAEDVNNFLSEKYNVKALPIILSEDKKSLVIGLNLATNKVDRECGKKFYRIKVDKLKHE